MVKIIIINMITIKSIHIGNNIMNNCIIKKIIIRVTKYKQITYRRKLKRNMSHQEVQIQNSKKYQALKRKN